jgi:hypothetical protein
MDSGYRTPLIDLFRRGDADRQVRLLGARGALALRAHEQLALLMILLDDADAEVSRRAEATIAALPGPALSSFLATPEVPDVMRDFFAARGVRPAAAAPALDGSDDFAEPSLDTLDQDPEAGTVPASSALLSSLPVIDRLKLATKGTREQRAQLIRDSNRIVATAVLSSPKLTEPEVEAFAKMGNVSEDVLRIIGTNRGWLKNYGIVLAVTKNPKTPPAISMQLMHRLTEKDIKMLTTDRNVPEALRLGARRVLAKAKHG